MKNSEFDKKLAALNQWSGDVAKRLHDMADRKSPGPAKVKGKMSSFRLAEDVTETIDWVVKNDGADTKTEAVENAVRGYYKG